MQNFLKQKQVQWPHTQSTLCPPITIISFCKEKKKKSSSSLQVNICEKHINKIKREIKGWIKVFLKSHCQIWSESHFSKLPRNKLRTQILLNEITKWIFTGCLCVVMTSSQTVMAHNVPRKMGQQLSFFVPARTKVQTPLVVFLFPVFDWLWWKCLF